MKNQETNQGNREEVRAIISIEGRRRGGKADWGQKAVYGGIGWLEIRAIKKRRGWKICSRKQEEEDEKEVRMNTEK